MNPLPSSPLSMELYTEPTLLQVILIYVGIPVLVTLVIVLLVSAPSWTRHGRYRPGMDWDNDPLWIGTETTVAPPRTIDGRAPAVEAAEAAATERPGEGPSDRGGSSARW
jgi:hypothetical protein